MGRRRRRRRGRRFSSTKAWPVLILAAVVYWAREFFGLSAEESLAAKLNELSDSALDFALLLLLLASIWLAIKTIGRARDRKDNQEAEQSKE